MRLRWMAGVVLGMASVCATEAVCAAAMPVMPMRAMFGRERLVKFDLRNETGAPLKLQCGEQAITVDPGKTMPMALPVGTRVVSVEATSKLAAGAVIASVTPDLSGVTVAVH